MPLPTGLWRVHREPQQGKEPGAVIQRRRKGDEHLRPARHARVRGQRGPGPRRRPAVQRVHEHGPDQLYARGAGGVAAHTYTSITTCKRAAPPSAHATVCLASTPNRRPHTLPPSPVLTLTPTSPPSFCSPDADRLQHWQEDPGAAGLAGARGLQLPGRPGAGGQRRPRAPAPRHGPGPQLELQPDLARVLPGPLGTPLLPGGVGLVVDAQGGVH